MRKSIVNIPQLFYNPKAYYADLKSLRHISLKDILFVGLLLFIVVSLMKSYCYFSINSSEEPLEVMVFMLGAIFGLFISYAIRTSVIYRTFIKLGMKLSFKDTSIIVLYAMFSNILFLVFAMFLGIASFSYYLPYIALLFNAIFMAFGINVYTGMNTLRVLLITIPIIIIEVFIFFAFYGMKF